MIASGGGWSEWRTINSQSSLVPFATVINTYSDNNTLILTSNQLTPLAHSGSTPPIPDIKHLHFGSWLIPTCDECVGCHPYNKPCSVGVMETVEVVGHSQCFGCLSISTYCHCQGRRRLTMTISSPKTVSNSPEGTDRGSYIKSLIRCALSFGK